MLVNLVNFTMSLGKPLTMSAQGFDNTAISSTLLIAGLINLPLPYALGWLSDRWGRRPILILSYLGGTLGMLVLFGSVDLWHFWTAQALISFIGSGSAVGAALVTDLVAPENLSASLARYDTARWLGGVLGYAGTGIAIQHLGLGATFILGALLPLIAITLIIRIHPPRLPVLRRAAAST
jgi:DHA1 family tetracycline resistance protein-like MFS transporter